MDQKYYKTKEVSEIAGIHRDTLLRWLREGKVQEPKRDRNNWRIFSDIDVTNILNFKHFLSEENPQYVAKEPPYSDHIAKLKQINWDFYDSNTNYLNHSVHPYPCKFVPQIPNILIQELSSIGDTVIDPFAGSGTTLVEALRLGRNAIGIDANPLSELICRAKSRKIEKIECGELFEIAEELAAHGNSFSSNQQSLFSETESKQNNFPSIKVDPWINEWFEKFVIDELSLIKTRCSQIADQAIRDLAFLAFSSIIVTVSKQDSDTRYVRKDKKISPGDTLKKFSSALENAVKRQIEFSSEIQGDVSATVLKGNILNDIECPSFDLLVCSPPYPNAFSYHLYHRSRMLWLGMDPKNFKRDEIGSHRKYSSKGKNAATKETFSQELKKIFIWISKKLKRNRHACVVIGNSTIGGKIVKNDKLLIKIAQETGFILEANVTRTIRSTKKSFNPKIGKIKKENIVILKNKSGGN